MLLDRHKSNSGIVNFRTAQKSPYILKKGQWDKNQSKYDQVLLRWPLQSLVCYARNWFFENGIFHFIYPFSFWENLPIVDCGYWPIWQDMHTYLYPHPLSLDVITIQVSDGCVGSLLVIHMLQKAIQSAWCACDRARKRERERLGEREGIDSQFCRTGVILDWLE